MSKTRPITKRELESLKGQLKPGERLYEAVVTIRFASALSFEDAYSSVRNLTNRIHRDRRAEGYFSFQTLAGATK